jgi:NAD-dependent deacetylase
MPITDSDVAAAHGVLARAERVTVLTGAGISTDSGIPDFRGPNGLWTKNPAAEKASNLSAYLGDPEVRRQAWQNRLEHPAWNARPNAGHLALVELERQGRLVALLTQNIDELHQLAGNDPEKVVELHGTMRWVVCWSCGQRTSMQEVLDRVSGGEKDPACLTCEGILKSATISFGQSLDPDVITEAERAALACDAFLAVGSTLAVYPAAGFASVAKDNGASLVIVNAEPTGFDTIADAVVRGSISDILPALVAP